MLRKMNREVYSSRVFSLTFNLQTSCRKINNLNILKNAKFILFFLLLWLEYLYEQMKLKTCEIGIIIAHPKGATIGWEDRLPVE